MTLSEIAWDKWAHWKRKFRWYGHVIRKKTIFPLSFYKVTPLHKWRGRLEKMVLTMSLSGPEYPSETQTLTRNLNIWRDLVRFSAEQRVYEHAQSWDWSYAFCQNKNKKKRISNFNIYHDLFLVNILFSLSWFNPFDANDIQTSHEIFLPPIEKLLSV